MRSWRNWYTRNVEVVVGQPMEVQLFSTAPLFLVKYRQKNMAGSEDSAAIWLRISIITMGYLLCPDLPLLGVWVLEAVIIPV